MRYADVVQEPILVESSAFLNRIPAQPPPANRTIVSEPVFGDADGTQMGAAGKNVESSGSDAHLGDSGEKASLGQGKVRALLSL